MDNNKNLTRTRGESRSNAETRKMYPKDGADIGIKDGEKIGSTIKRVTKRSRPS